MPLTNIDEQMYRELPLINQSAIKHGLKSMAHMKAYIDGKIKFSSDALSLGSLVHAVVLEEDILHDLYAVMPKIDRRTKAGKEQYAEFLRINDDKTVCTQEDWDTAMAMRQAVWSHPASKSLLKRKGKTEQSLTWRHPLGIDCKGRIDLLLEGKGRQKPMIVDLKTTQDASPAGFARSVAKYGYHMQAAFYKDGMVHGADRNCGFAIIAVEKVEPYAVGVYILDDEALSQGRKDYEKVLTSWKDAVQSDTYPSYSDAPETLSLPEWAVTPEPLTV
jgi:hypothetical protein